MDEVDKLTLEWFVNKQTYKKYLAKHDPETFQESQAFYDKLDLYQSDIMQITENMLSNPDAETYNKTLRDSFESYVKTVLHHIEVESLSTKTDNRSGEIYDEDNGNEPDEMLIDVSPSIDYVSSLPVVSRKPENPIEYWKKYAVKKTWFNTYIM